MKSSDKKKLDFYKTQWNVREYELGSLKSLNARLTEQRLNWQSKYEDLLTDAEKVSTVITQQNDKLIEYRDLIADQQLQIANLEKGIKEVDTGKGILSIIFKGKN